MAKLYFVEITFNGLKHVLHIKRRTIGSILITSIGNYDTCFNPPKAQYISPEMSLDTLFEAAKSASLKNEVCC